MQTEIVPIDEPTPDPANARQHGERNIKAIIDSLKAFGQQKPIVVDKRGIVVAGNGTLEAAKRLGWSEISIVRSELDPTQATAFGIADNRTAELAEWDEEVLRSLLDSMDDEMLDVLNFSETEMGAFNIADVPFVELDNSENKTFRGMTFQLHEDQVAIVEKAIELAKSHGKNLSEVNANGAGNCIAAICQAYLGE